MLEICHSNFLNDYDNILSSQVKKKISLSNSRNFQHQKSRADRESQLWTQAKHVWEVCLDHTHSPPYHTRPASAHSLSSGLEGGYSREAGHTLPTSPCDWTPNGRLPRREPDTVSRCGFLLDKVREHRRAEQTGRLRSFRAYFAILIYFTFKQSWLLTVYLPNLTLSAIFKN